MHARSAGSQLARSSVRFCFCSPVGLWATLFALSTFPQAGRRADSSGFAVVCDRSFLIVAAEASPAVEDRVGSVVVLANLDPRLDEVCAQRARRDLQLQPVERHAIVIADLTFFLNAKDLAKIDPRDRDEGRAFLFGLHGKAPIVGGDVDVPKEKQNKGRRSDLHSASIHELGGICRGIRDGHGPAKLPAN